MSSATLKQALELALRLPLSERAALARDVLASLDGPTDADGVQAWEAEILRRLDELESGRAQTIEVELPRFRGRFAVLVSDFRLLDCSSILPAVQSAAAGGRSSAFFMSMGATFTLPRVRAPGARS